MILDASQGHKICLLGWGTGPYLPLMKIRKKSPNRALAWTPQDFLGFPQKQLILVSKRAIPRSWAWVVLSAPAWAILHTEDELSPVTWSCAQHTFSEWSKLYQPSQSFFLIFLSQGKHEQWAAFLKLGGAVGWSWCIAHLRLTRVRGKSNIFSWKDPERNTWHGCSCCYHCALWMPPPATPTVSNS